MTCGYYKASCHDQAINNAYNTYNCKNETQCVQHKQPNLEPFRLSIFTPNLILRKIFHFHIN
nr:MAG TPA: hypothetical protein [Caudoviricetes sp.]